MISTPTQGILNRLYYGDCLSVMQQLNAGSVDLIYLDPPFKSDRDYNSIYKDETGRPLPDQIKAFEDTWDYSTKTEKSIRNTTIKMLSGGLDENHVKMWENFTKGLKAFDDEMLAYVVYMAERILEMKRLLKDTGSIYLHCDPSASHYLKILMDIIFGERNFLNEIVWHYGKYTNAARHYQKNHDVILAYVKVRNNHCFNKQFTDGAQSTKVDYERGFRRHRPGGVPQLLVYDKSKAKEAIRQAELDKCKIVYRDGKTKVALSDVWNIPIIGSTSKERLGYATQKPLALLKRIIAASSNEGDVVLDPFCGCATTIEAAHSLKRRWLGVDLTIHAINRVSRDRLKHRLNLDEGQDYLIEGVPISHEGAVDLWKQDPFEFQKWAIEEVDGFMTSRKTRDGGIDGRIYFEEPNNKDLQSMVLEVKGGKSVNVNILRDLRGVLDREGERMAGLILLHKLSDRKRKNFEKEIATAGFVEIDGKSYARMQILTIDEILDGRSFNISGYARGRSSTAELRLL